MSRRRVSLPRAEGQVHELQTRINAILDDIYQRIEKGQSTAADAVEAAAAPAPTQTIIRTTTGVSVGHSHRQTRVFCCFWSFF